MLCKLTGIVVFRHRSAAEAAHTQSGGDRPTESRARLSESHRVQMGCRSSGACGPGGTAGVAGPDGCPQLADLSCQVETPLRVFLHSCGTSYLRFRPAAVLQCTACGRMPGSTTDQSGAGGRCVHIQPPGQDHRWLGRGPSSRGHSCQLVAVLSLGVGSTVGYSWWQGHRVGCGGAGDSARGDRSRSSPLVE